MINRGRKTLESSAKAQSIAINTIIIAAIALVVLVITFIIFTGQSASTTKTLQSCELKNGKCAEKVGKDKDGKPACGGEYPIPIYISDPLCGESKLCCLKIG